MLDDTDRFLAWARRACLPLDRLPGEDAALDAPLRALIGAARIVSLGEGLHGAREPLDFRNALLAWLVRQLDFSAIALESGLSEGLALDRYVQGEGGDEDVHALLPEGITSGLHGFPQQATLLRWMRAFNAGRDEAQRLSFHGIDTSRLAGRPGAALDVALDLIDPAEAAAWRARLAEFRPSLDVDRMALQPTGYATLDAPRREALGLIVAGLAARLEQAPATPAALEAAIAARQAEHYLRQFPVGWSAAQGAAGIWPSVAVSDRCKADNVERISQRERGGLLLFSHLGHASTRPVSIELGASRIELPTMMGRHLHQRFGGGGELLTIGHLIGAGAAHGSLEARLATLGHRALLLDLRGAPPEVRALLNAAPHPLNGQQPLHLLSPGLGIDIVFFTLTADPAN